MHGDVVVELMGVQKTLNFEIRKLQLSMVSLSYAREDWKRVDIATCGCYSKVARC